MKFERLTIPDWQLPDLVAFNQRVHERVDPWWQRRWVRRRHLGRRRPVHLVRARSGSISRAACPRRRRLLAYQPPLPTNVRGYDGTPVQTFARERRVELSYDEYPAAGRPRLHLGRGQEFLQPSRDRLHRADRRGRRFHGEERHRRRPRQGRVDDHPAGRQISAEGFELQHRPQGPRGDPRLPPRIDPEQAADPRALPQFDLPRPQRLWRPGGGARLFRQGRQRADACRKPPISRCCRRRRPITIRCARPRRRSTAATMCCARCTATATSARTQWKAAAATPLGTIRYGSNEKFRQQGGYFMEEVRRELIKRFGENAKDGPNSLYAGGLWVRTSMDPKMQDAAAQALARRPGASSTAARGWRDLGHDASTCPATGPAQLDRAPVGTGYPDWRKAVVLSKSGGEATIGFTNGSTRDACRPRRASMPVRGVGGRAFDALKPGMVIIVKQIGAGSYAAALGPRDLGRNARRGSPHRPRARDAGRLRRRRLELQPGDPGASPAGLGVQADRLCDRARERLHAGDDRDGCAVLRLAGRGARQQMLRQLRPPLRRARTRCAGASSSRAT